MRTCVRIHHRPTDSSEDRTGNEAHRRVSHKACKHVLKYVEKYVIIGGSVVRMNMLRDRYFDYIRENAPQFYNQ